MKWAAPGGGGVTVLEAFKERLDVAFSAMGYGHGGLDDPTSLFRPKSRCNQTVTASNWSPVMMGTFRKTSVTPVTGGC